MDTLTRLCVVGLAVAGVLAGSAAAQAPSLTDVPATGLTADHQKMIDAYVEHWAKALLAADNAQRVIEIRTILMRGYNFRGDSEEYKDIYAGSMADRLRATLAKPLPADDKLASLKEVNLAISVNRMSQTSLRALAELMVRHQNPAVRYFGWNVYSVLRPGLLAEGGDGLGALFTTTAKTAEIETDPLVLSQLVRTLYLPPTRPQTVAQDTYRTAQQKFLAILQAGWNRLCGRVLSMAPGFAETTASGVNAAGALAKALGEDSARKTALQMVLNAAWASGSAFDRSGQMLAVVADARKIEETGEGDLDDVRKTAEKLGTTLEALMSQTGNLQQTVSTNAVLLKECEETLNALIDKAPPGNRHIRRPLSSGDRKSGAAVQFGVLTWIDALIKSHQLKHPKSLVSAAKPTTAPATKPATAPATKPATQPAK